MARKPLIEQGSILAGPDTLSRVIARDREQSGRHSPTPPEEDALPEDLQEGLQERNLTTLQENFIPSKEELKVSDKLRSKLPSNGEADAATPGASPPKATDRAKATDRETRLARAMGVAAEDEMIVVSVRVPGKLNDYIDQYVARVAKANPKRRYRKQDAMAEALAGFIADHPMPTVSVEEEF